MRGLLVDLSPVQKGEEVRRETKFLVLMAAIVAIAYVLIAPIPEMDATEFRQVALVVVINAVSDSLFHKIVTPIFVARCRTGDSPLLKDASDILAVLCVRTC